MDCAHRALWTGHAYIQTYIFTSMLKIVHFSSYNTDFANIATCSMVPDKYMRRLEYAKNYNKPQCILLASHIES
jgi:hypothetical protein